MGQIKNIKLHIVTDIKGDMEENIDQLILEQVDKAGTVDTYKLSDVYKKDHQLFVGAVKRLESLGNVISAALKSTERWVLTPEGQTMASNGSYEAVLFNLVPAEGLKQSELAKEVIKSYTVTKGEGFTLTIEKPEADLTSEMLANGAWKTKKFKDYNF